jgi:spermine/spermidine synthase
MKQRTIVGTCIVGLSLGAGLLSLVALRWIGFLGLPPVIFLTLLLVGMPLGGLLLIKINWLRNLSISAISIISCCLAIVAAAGFLLLIQTSKVLVDIPDVEMHVLALNVLVRFLVVVAAFFPLFIGYGLIELAAYRFGLSKLNGKSALVYALNLVGLILAFGLYRLLLVGLGTSGLFIIGLAGVLASSYFLTPRRWAILVACLLCLAALFIPGREAWTVASLEVKTGQATFNKWKAKPNKVLYDGWTPHCRLAIIDQAWGISGFYDGLFYWFFARDMPDPKQRPSFYRRLDLAFSLLIRPGDSVAVLGSGGGVQVAAALKAGAGRVVAVEVVPEVLSLLSGPLAKNVDGVYSDPRVELVPKNARRYLEQTDQTFDFIVVASVESNLGGFRDLFEPSQVMFTKEAFAAIKAHLNPGGFLSLSKYTAVDRRGVIFAQSFEQLSRLGLNTRGYVKLPSLNTKLAGYHRLMANATHYLVLAQNGPGSYDSFATLDNIYRSTNVKKVKKLPDAFDLPEITDDRAFATGLIIANMGTWPLALGIGGVGAILLLVAFVLALLLRKNSQGGYGRVSLASVAVGFNFITLEYLIVYRLMDRLDIPMDATFLGMILFAGLAAAGSVLLARRSAGHIIKLCAFLALPLALAGYLLPIASLVLAAGAGFVSGSFFPRILKGLDNTLVRVYIWDAYGALWGGLLALLVPLFLGFSGHQALCGLALVIGAWTVWRTESGRRPGETK